MPRLTPSVQPQVVGIDDQILQPCPAPSIFTCTLVQLLFCATVRIRTIDPFRPQL